MKYKRIPKYIDAPVQFLWWEMQEGLLIVFLTIGSMILFHQALYGVVVGVLIASQYAKFKENNIRGYFTHYLYYFGFLNVKKVVKPYQKYIIR